GQYYGCTGLTAPAEEVLPDSVNSIGSNFRYGQYYGCTGLTAPAEEVLPDSVNSIGSNFRRYQYQNCTNLLIGNHIHSYQFATLLNTSSSYEHIFYLSSEKVDADNIPKYYTDTNKTATAPITDLIPSQRKYYLTNRTGIDGYDQLNDNWK
ncbi:MAG: hypothetical protein LUH10_00505, partial [Tannerellaceae bacterium]|nr:hypothetical protein [Tannerellaceae bacterium]